MGTASSDRSQPSSLRSVGGLPTLELPELFHVGSLDIKDKGRRFSSSQEGHGLSVSLDPEKWERIAKLRGPRWRLSRLGARFLDAHDLTDAARDQIGEWAVQSGYAVRSRAWALSHDWEFEDEPLPVRCESIFTNQAEAEDEATELEAPLIREIRTLLGTEKLRRRIGMKSDPNEVFDHLLPLYVEECLPELDGVWWQDIYAELSAPRGVIVPARLMLWQRRLEAD